MEYRTIAYRGDFNFYHDFVEAGSIPALGGFNLEFTNSDHHIRALSVGGVPTGTSGSDFDGFLLGFSDSDDLTILTHVDPTNLWAKYFPIGPGPTFTATGSGRGNETVSVPTVVTGEDDLFVLRGFSIQTARDSDHNLRRLAIRHNKAGNSVSVTFHDDSPGDDGFSFTVVYTIVQLANTSGRRAEYYFTGPYSQSFNFINSTTVDKNLSGFSVLAGFDFRFNDNDHHIRQIRIDPVSEEQFGVTFTDDERDNAVSGWIEYVIVHD